MKKSLNKLKGKVTQPVNDKFAKIEQINRDLSLQIADVREENLEKLDDLETKLDGLEIKLNNILEASKVITERVQEKTRQLWEVRESKEYQSIYNSKQPLVTVRIASYNKTASLVDKAIRSVLRQSYSNIEIVIVNDGPNKDTKEAIEKLKDPRIRYYELPLRGSYPNEDKKRWQVAGSPGMNYGAYLARGEWIAPLDDDDEFTEDHIEKLLEEALRKKHEIVFGAFSQTVIDGKNKRTSTTQPSSKPQYGKFTMQASLYIKPLEKIFSYNRYSYIYDEPGDWNLITQMLDSGVRLGTIPDVAVKIEHILDLSTRA